MARRNGDVSAPIREAALDKCTFKGGCDKPHHRAGLCAGHNTQKLRGLPLTPLRGRKRRGGPCEAGDCPHGASNDGLCSGHYNRKISGEPNWERPLKYRAKNGSGSISRYGYRVIYLNGRARLEHRVIMQQLLGRPLHKGENIHHVNGNRIDNRTDGPLRWVNGKLRSGNLELWSTKQPPGQEIGPKLEWAMEMQEEYDPYLTADYLERMAATLERRGYQIRRAA
jgi:hypothetical protein